MQALTRSISYIWPQHKQEKKKEECVILRQFMSDMQTANDLRNKPSELGSVGTFQDYK